MSNDTATYGQGHAKAVLAGHGSRSAHKFCTYFTHLLKPTSTILDIGCGPGSITVTLAEFVPEGSIIGIDFSSEVIAAAQQGASTNGPVPSNCSFAVADVCRLPYSDASFDVVHCNFVLCHLPDPLAALREMRRVCKPRGFVAAREGDWESVVIHPADDALRLWKSVNERNFRRVGSEPDAARRMLQWAYEAGFEEEGVTFQTDCETMTYAGREAGRWWGEHWLRRVEEDDKWRKGVVESGLATEVQLDEMRDGWRRFAEARAPVYSMICGLLVCYK